MLVRLRENYPGIAWHPGQSGKPGPFIEYLLKRLQVGSVSQKIKHRSGVNCPGTGAHRDPVQRCKSHRSVYASGSAHCGQRTPATQMAEDLTEVLVILATDNPSRSLAGVPKAGPMETVSDESFLNPLKRSGISSRSLGQRAMKRRVKDRELRHLAAQNFSANRDSDQAVGIVEWSKFAQSFDSRFNLRIYQRCAAEFQTAVNHTMADQVDLIRHFENRGLAFPGCPDQRFELFRKR